MSGGIKLVYDRKEYVRTRQLPGKWDLASYRYKFDATALQIFNDKLKEKKLMGLKCRGCNTVYFPPRVVCGKCLIAPDKWVPLPDTGVVATFTATYKKDPVTGKQVPEPVIAVRVDGSDTTHTIELTGIKFDDVYVGLPVKMKWREVTQGSLNDIECCVPIEDFTLKMPLFEVDKVEVPVAPAKTAPAAAKPVPTPAPAAAAPTPVEKAAPVKKAAKKAAAKKAAKKSAKKAAKPAK